MLRGDQEGLEVLHPRLYSERPGKAQSFVEDFMRLQKGLAAALMLAGAAALLGQTPTGSISGVITDSSGAVVPGAKVTVTDVGKGISRSVATDGAGRYQAPGLIPGNYEIQAQMEGFQTEIHKGIQLTVGMDAVINLSLQVGQVAQTTVVSGEAPLVETVTGTVSGLVDDREIRDLPLNGRSFDQLIGLQSSTPMFHNRATTAATGRSAIFSMSGARGNANVYSGNPQNPARSPGNRPKNPGFNEAAKNGGLGGLLERALHQSQPWLLPRGSQPGKFRSQLRSGIARCG